MARFPVPRGAVRPGVGTNQVATLAAGRKLKQGRHPDPLDPATPPPDPVRWTARERDAFESEEMAVFRRSLLLPGSDDIRASIIDDLATHFQVSPDEVVPRCLEWESWAADEWEAAPRETTDQILDFHRRTVATAFDVAWYAYLQAERYLYPVSVALARTLRPHRPGASHLDFGAGCGATAAFFAQLGYETTLADVSTSLLEFARFRLARRNIPARFVDLNTATIGEERYDVITAIDVLMLVPDLAKTADELHRALRPGGVLFTNFDTRPMTRENAWHLYEDDLPLRYTLHRAGFEPEEKLDGMITRYRRVPRSGPIYVARGLRDRVLLRPAVRQAVRGARRLARSITHLPQVRASGHAG